MKPSVNRREFMKAAALASASAMAVGQTTTTQGAEAAPASSNTPKETMPMGQIGKHQFSRMIMGGNLISGYAHARDLGYVAVLMRQYNTEAKILETLELGENQGINAINLFVGDDLSFIHKHWARGGKLKLILQAHIGENGELTQFQKAVDMGASAIHVQGHSAERKVEQKQIDQIARAMEFVKKNGAAAGVAAHALDVIVECEKAKLDVDFYQKTLHTRDYFTAGLPGDKEDVGRNDNYWCRNPEETIAFMAKVKKPWIAFKVLAAGAINPRAGFSYALKNGADFLLVGMFDWQVADDAKLARRMFSSIERTRPFYGAMGT